MIKMENKNISRRDFCLELILGGAILPSLALSEERNFNPKLKGWAIQDPSNKQNINGFIHIPTVWGEHLKSPEPIEELSPLPQRLYDSNLGRVYYSNLRRANIGLVEAIKKYTNFNAYSDAHLYLSSNKLIEYPFIYIATDKAFKLTKTERENFEYYLRNGGFALLESLDPQYRFYCWADYGQAETSLKQMTRDVLKKDARFSPIPNSHPLYHCFFDFDDGPPQGTEVNWVYTDTPSYEMYNGMNPRNITMPRIRYYLEGIFLDDKLVAIYSGKGYGQKWKDISNNEPQQKMGVNFVVYALTQKGGIAKKDKQ
jgi:hypothetical protein